jgi:uncharacterized cupin superfamily protein
MEPFDLRQVNLLEAEVGRDEGDPPGYDTGYVRVGPLVGAELLGLSVFELPPGQSICPYHYEVGNEEWLIVVSGGPTLRTPEGERELDVWDAVFFPSGEAGAHKVTNRTDETLRVAIWSTKIDPSLAVYPDSSKIGVWPPGKLFRLDDAVDYWDGER